MDDAQLEHLLEDLESDRTERTITKNDVDKLSEAICAFANDMPNYRQPGVMFVGVNNDGSCGNIGIDDQLLLTLSHLRDRGNILPFPMMSVQKKVFKGCELAVIIVEPSHAPPVRYKGRTWIRVGPRRAIATTEEERRLAEKRRAGDLPFDIEAVQAATLSDLDIDLFEREYLPSALALDILEQNQRTTEQQLASLRFAVGGVHVMPTVLGLLVIGKDPRSFISGAYIQFLRLDGTELTDPIKDQKEITGPLPNVLRILDETFQAHIAIATDLGTTSIEIKHPDYPIMTLQQLARNAVLHRRYDGTNAPIRITWFTNRIEIQSPGGPFGQVTRDNFGMPGITDYRNPHLAEAMKNLGYVQRFGVGIQLARRELDKNGNPPLEFVIEETHVLAIIRA
jgi:ATP-dependent DNA helicase RecG